MFTDMTCKNLNVLSTPVLGASGSITMYSGIRAPCSSATPCELDKVVITILLKNTIDNVLVRSSHWSLRKIVLHHFLLMYMLMACGIRFEECEITSVISPDKETKPKSVVKAKQSYLKYSKKAKNSCSLA